MPPAKHELKVQEHQVARTVGLFFPEDTMEGRGGGEMKNAISDQPDSPSSHQVLLRGSVTHLLDTPFASESSPEGDLSRVTVLYHQAALVSVIPFRKLLFKGASQVSAPTHRFCQQDWNQSF